MRLLPGGVQTVAMESITGKLLIEAGINNPDKIPTVFRIFQDEESDLLSILDIKGLKTKNLNFATNDSNYRTVGSNHIQYAIANDDRRKIHFKTNVYGVTYESDAYPTEPGKNQTPFYVYVDSNWAGFQEIIELGDNRTNLYILTDPEEKFGAWRLKVKIHTPEESDFVDVALLQEGYEAAAVMTAHEHDFSERGVEKYPFNGWGHCHLTLQRFKYSWSGTAKAMKTTSGYWAEHKGETSFITEAQYLMMKRAAEYLNYQIINGKSSVSQSTSKVILHNDKGREVLTGSGIMNAGDGAIEIPYQSWAPAVLEGLLTEIDSYITKGEDGKREIVALMSPLASLGFSSMMKTMGVTQNNNLVGDGADKGMIDTYAFYEVDGLRVIPKRSSSLNSRIRPGIRLSDGTYSNDHDVILIPLGKTTGGNRGVELVQLRPMSKGTVAGIDMGGNIASSVDGSQEHILFQNGVISRIQPFKMYRPYQS